MHMLAFAAVLAGAACVTAQDAAKANLVKNGGFESGGTHESAQWSRIWPRKLLNTEPTFDRSKQDPHAGKACAVLTLPEAGGYSSFTQEISSPPDGAKAVLVEGWVDFTPDPNTPGTPSVMIVFADPSKPDSSTIRAAELPPGATGWTKLSFAASVPDGATKWLVRCGMAGCGTARFDDVVVTASTKPVDPVVLLRAHGDYSLTEHAGAADPWLEFSFPFPFEGQTPLAIRLTTTPPGRVAKCEIVADDENRHLRVHLEPQGKGTTTAVRLDALVMVRDRAVANGDKIALAPKAKLPREVARYFERTPGIDAGDADIAAAVRDVKTDTLANAIDGVLAWLRANFRYEGGGDQGGKASFERKYAVCTGHANLAASMFQAAGVPCRVLGCIVGARLQQHYIVEVWAPSAGWLRVESTGKAFPIQDSHHLILHVAHPKLYRSPGNVPLHIRAADDCTANFATGADTCWQGMVPAGTPGLEPAVAVAVEKAARDAFAAWEKRPATTASIRLLPGPAAAKAEAVAREVDAFLAEK